MFGLSREKSVVGLDIGSYSVKAVELRARKKGGGEAYDLVKIGYEPLPHDAIVEGTIIDSAAVVETIRLLFEENKISTKDVAISRPSTISPIPTRRPTSTTPSSSLRGRPTRRTWTSCSSPPRRTRSPTTATSSPRPGRTCRASRSTSSPSRTSSKRTTPRASPTRRSP